MSVATRARRLAAPVGRPLRRAAVGLRTRDWPAHSRLFVEQEAAEWVLSYEARQLVRTAEALGVELGPPGWARGVANQAIFHLSQFTLLQHDFERDGNNLGSLVLPRPAGNAGDAGVRRVLRHAARAAPRDRPRPGDEPRDGGRSCSRRGSPPRRCTRSRSASTRTSSARATTVPRGRPRRGSACPGTAFVVGSFQKDGVGWGEGLEPKLDQRARRPPRGRRTSRRDAPGAPLPADRPGARLRPLGARAPRHPVPPPSAARRRRGRGDVPGDRRVPRRLA